MRLIPAPRELKKKDGTCILTCGSTIAVLSSCEKKALLWADFLKEEMRTSMGYDLAAVRRISGRTAVIMEECSGLMPEEYLLEITEGGVHLRGGRPRGLLYGVQTLRQIIRQYGAVLPCLEIRDYPQIHERGYYLDVSRGRIPTLEWLKQEADLLAFYKINQFQLYIEHTFLFENLSEVWRDDTPLTAEEILELDAYCSDRGIDLVPSLASFGHMYKILRTRSFGRYCERPELLGEDFGFLDRMRHHTLNVSEPDSLTFIKELIDEYLQLFTSEYFNICADETFDLGKGQSRELAARKGEKELYISFVRELCIYLTDKGKTPMFWGDIISGFPQALKELPENTICLNWGYDRNQGEEQVRKLKEAEAVQYCCPGVSGWDQFVNNNDAAYENIKRMCTYAVRNSAKGVLNTDWGDCGHVNHPDFSVIGMIYGAAFSWNPQIPEKEKIDRQISVLEFGDSTGEIVSLISELPKGWLYRWRDAVDYFEKNETDFSPSVLAGTKEAIEFLKKAERGLYEKISALDTSRRRKIWPYLIAVRGMILFQEFGTILGEWEYGICPSVKVEPWELAAGLERWLYEYKMLWREVSRESELFRIQEVICRMADLLRSRQKNTDDTRRMQDDYHTDL